MAGVTICSDFGAPQNKVWHCFHCYPSICHEVMGPDAMILVFWMLNFRPTFSLSSVTFIRRLFSSSLSAIRVVSSAYLRLLIFLLAILFASIHIFSNILAPLSFLHLRPSFSSAYMEISEFPLVVQLLSHVQLFATPWTVSHKSSLSFTISWSLLNLMPF